MYKTFAPLAVTCILVGILLILENFSFIPPISMWWPLFPFLIGLGMTQLFFERGRQDVIIISTATYLLTVSIFFFYLNCSSWHLLKELWPIFISIIGFSFIPAILFAAERKIIIFLSFFLIILGILLFFIFKIDVRLWPLTLVLFGLSILIIMIGGHHESKGSVR